MARERAGERAEATAERILDGALRAGEIYGFRKLTMDEIAKHAGLARVTIYTHYANKDAIVSALVSRELQAVLATVSAIGDAQTDPVERLVEMFTFGYGWLRDHALLQRIIRTEPEAILPYAAYDSPLLVVGRQWIAGQLATSFSGGDQDPEVFEEAAELIVRIVQSLVLSPVSIYDLTDPDGVRTLVRRWIIPIVQEAVSGVRAD
ncbi:TetR/AcrR family transcriptional regulator [Nocardia sp. NPDC056000]|uniref:TetR/AcrR family transcriptional regulator n=1 Tax=Nocardia sp. NPDC056000 TaxID=3345674 RepID=UPI0035E097C8